MEINKGEKNLQLPSAKPREFFRKYVDLIQTMMGKSYQLRKREADVLSELLYFNYIKKDIKDLEDRSRIIFDISTRKLMQQNLGKRSRKGDKVVEPLSNAVIQQALGGLRKKGYIKGITIASFLMAEPVDSKFKLSFMFKVDEV
jgi:hypothetical protein